MYLYLMLKMKDNYNDFPGLSGFSQHMHPNTRGSMSNSQTLSC